mmetsp:Transcript_32590/g.50967  ORF Transcript_32590/g.50967 Transcript_32590/m.50967 type:complete len:269 (-) Transcript_32590:199-1005(-)
MKKILVFGASGFVGSHIVSEFVKASAREQTRKQSSGAIGKFSLVGISRNPKKVQKDVENASNDRAMAMRQIRWDSCDALDREAVRALFDRHPETTAVISCIGGFGTTEESMRKANGPPNINLVHAVYETSDIQKMVYISAAQIINKNLTRLSRGYYNGKLSVEEAMTKHLESRGIILQPGFIYGRRTIAGKDFPLSIIGMPLELLAKPFYSISHCKLITPPIAVECVARCALSGCTIGENLSPDVQKVWPRKLEYDQIHEVLKGYDYN